MHRKLVILSVSYNEFTTEIPEDPIPVDPFGTAYFFGLLKMDCLKSLYLEKKVKFFKKDYFSKQAAKRALKLIHTTEEHSSCY